MRVRSLLGALLTFGLVMPIVSCNGSYSVSSIQITPASQNVGADGTAQFTATGVFTYGSHPPQTRDITSQVTWSSSSTNIATINSSGAATGVAAGTATITASMKGFTGLVSATATLTVTGGSGNTGGGTGGTGGSGSTNTSGDVTAIAVIPSSQTVLSLNTTAQFIAIGTTAGGASIDLTDQVNWVSSVRTIATINGTGVATAIGAGTTAITAVYTNSDGTAATGTASFTVAPTGSPEPLVSLAIVPASQSALAINQTAQFIAIGTTGSGATVDLTSSATWVSTNVKIATVSATGLATALSAGTTAITAIAKNPDGTVVTGSASFTVTVPATTEPLVSLAIVPASQTALATGQTAQFMAIGTTGSGTTVNLTDQSATIGGVTINAAAWNSSNPAVATINSASGIATALSAGATAITAIATNPDGTVVTGTATYTVTPALVQEPYISLTIIPTSQTASSVGETAQFIAVATTGSGTQVDLTTQCLWTSSDTRVANVSSTTGLATAANTGTSAITAEHTNPDGTVVSATAAFTVSIAGTQEPLLSLSVDPTAQTILGLKQTTQFLAIGATSSGTTVDLTNQTATVDGSTINAATWTSSNPAVATIDPNTGVATALTSGVTTITAIVKNPDGSVVTGTSALTVNIPTAPEPLVSLSISPTTQTASSANETAQFIAIGTTGSGTTVDLTDQSATVGGATINPVQWSSSDTSVATIDPATGLATALTSGTTAITAIATNPDGTVVTTTATFTVKIAATQEPLLSLTIIPVSQAVNTPYETSQFLAIGTFSGSAAQTTSICGSTGTTQDCTNYVTWSSSDVKVATINSTGLATALDTIGTTAITAIAKNPDGTLVTGTAALTQKLDSTGPIQQSTLTVTLMGTNAANGYVSAYSPTANPPNSGPLVIDCGNGSTSGQAGCTNTFPVTDTVANGDPVVLTATPKNGAQFGGWSDNCTPTAPINPTGTNSCTVSMGNNQTVAAIFY